MNNCNNLKQSNMKYLYVGALMLLASLVLALIFFGWKLTLVLVLGVQGHAIVLRANDKINDQHRHIDDGLGNVYSVYD
jgi:uncharacterized membrane protein